MTNGTFGTQWQSLISTPPVCRKYDNSRSALPHRHPRSQRVAHDLDPGPALPPALQGLQSSRYPLTVPERDH